MIMFNDLTMSNFWFENINFQKLVNLTGSQKYSRY